MSQEFGVKTNNQILAKQFKNQNSSVCLSVWHFSSLVFVNINHSPKDCKLGFSPEFFINFVGSQSFTYYARPRTNRDYSSIHSFILASNLFFVGTVYNDMNFIVIKLSMFYLVVVCTKTYICNFK